MEEEEEESGDETAKSLAKKQTFPSLWYRVIRFGKTMAIAGAAVSSAPVVIPPAVVGFAFSVPFGVYFAGLVYTENVMRALFLSNCHCEIVKNQDVEVVGQDKETSPTSLCYSNANPEEIEIEHISQDDIHEKYFDGGTYANTNSVQYTAQKDENSSTSGSDERSGDDICIIMQSSLDDKCDCKLPLSSNNAECREIIFPVHFEEEAHNEAGCRDLEIQYASENDNDRNSEGTIYYEEQKKLSELQQHGCGLGIEALGLNEALHKLEERSIGEKDDIKEDGDIKEEEDRKEEDDIKEDEDIKEDDMKEDVIKEDDIKEDDMKEDDIKEDDIKEDVDYSFNVVEPITEMKESVVRKDDESMNEDIDPNKQNSNAETYNEEKKNISTFQQHGCGLGIEEFGLNEALHKMEVRVVAEKLGINECNNSPFTVLEPLVENEERDISNSDEPMNDDMKLDDQELDSVHLKDDHGKEECELEDGSKIKAEVDGKAIVTTGFENVSTGDTESEYGSVHVTGGDDSHGETNQSTVKELDELTEFENEATMPEKQTFEKDEKVIEENEKRIETYAFPITTDQPLDGSTETTSLCKTNDEIVDEQLYNPVHFDKKGSGELQVRDDSSAKMDVDHETMLQPNPNEEEINIKNDDIEEHGPTQHEDNDAGQIDFTELKDDIIMDTGKEEDIRVGTEMSGEYPRETGTDEALQTPYIEFKVDTNWDTSKQEEETPLLANIEKEDEMEGNIEHNEETDVCMERKIESLDDMLDLTNVVDENPNLEDRNNNLKVQEDTSENQPKPSYLFAAIMPKEAEREIVDHTNEKGTLEVKQQESTGDGSFMEKDDKPLAELPTVPEEREMNFEFPDSSSEKTLSPSISNSDRVKEKITKNQPETDLLAAMSKKFENEVANHSNEMEISDSVKQELNIDGSSMVKDDESVRNLPTVHEEHESNFEFSNPSSKQALLSLNRADKKVDDSIGDEAMVENNETVEQIAVIESIVEYEHEDVESSFSIGYACDIENHSSDITSAENRAEVTIVDGSEVVYFHDEVIYREDTMWEQIEALRTIIGCNAAIMRSSLTDELKALYLLIGVEPPASLEETSDLIEVNEKLEFLKSVIGVK